MGTSQRDSNIKHVMEKIHKFFHSCFVAWMIQYFLRSKYLLLVGGGSVTYSTGHCASIFWNHIKYASVSECSQIGLFFEKSKGQLTESLKNSKRWIGWVSHVSHHQKKVYTLKGSQINPYMPIGTYMYWQRAKNSNCSDFDNTRQSSCMLWGGGRSEDIFCSFGHQMDLYAKTYSQWVILTRN